MAPPAASVLVGVNPVFALLLCALPVSVIDMADEPPLPVYRPKNSLERAGVHTAVAALGTLGEGRTVQLILAAAPHLLNVAKSEEARVRNDLGARYAELGADPRWDHIPSPLRSAFEPLTPTMIVAPPVEGPREKAPVVLFLHGYGGNGKLFAFLLARAMPNAWIVSPSHGLTWSRPRLRYLDRALERFEETYGLDGPRYHLVGLSDGAVGAFEVLAARPARFERMVSIVGVPRPRTIGRLPKDTPILMLNGRTDRFVPARGVRARFRRLMRRGTVTLSWHDGGHYFLLEEDGAALEEIREFLSASP